MVLSTGIISSLLYKISKMKVKHKLKQQLKLCLWLPLMYMGAPAFSQDHCAPVIIDDCWFSQIREVAYSPDGSKFLVHGASSSSRKPNYDGSSGNCTTSSSTSSADGIYVYDIATDGTISNNIVMSKWDYNVNGDIHFTNNNGYWFERTTSRLIYVNTAGEETSFSTYFLAATSMSQVHGHPNSLVTLYGDENMLLILNDDNTSSPTVTEVILPSSDTDFANRVAAAKYDAGSGLYRIFYEAGLPEASSASNPDLRVIRKVDWNGSMIVDGSSVFGPWTDVKVERGRVQSLQVRMTDGLIFGRLGPIGLGSSGAYGPIHGMLVFDQNGTLQNQFNTTDLSLLTGNGDDGNPEVRFDNEGNIYANMYSLSGGNEYSMMLSGVVRFGPLGNLDLGFYRNILKSYANPIGSGARYFDIADNGTIIKSAYTNIWDNNYRIEEGEKQMGDLKEEYTHAPDPPYNNTAISSVGNPSKYSNVQFFFSSGKLVRPRMSTEATTTNCGVSEPLFLPVASPPADGSILCDQTKLIEAPMDGLPSKLSLVVTLDVTTPGGISPIVVTGSGMSLQDPGFTIEVSQTGQQDYIIPLTYDGSALGNFEFTVGDLGSCVVDLSDMNHTVSADVQIWTLEKCSFKLSGPSLK